MTEELTPEGIDDVTERAEGFSPSAVPCKIHMKTDKTFIVDKIAAWGWVPQGLYANGHFKGYSGEIDVLIAESSVEYIELDYPALKRYLDQQDKHAQTHSPTAPTVPVVVG